MTTRNDITGDLIQTKTTSDDKYADGWERIFGKKNKVASPETTPSESVEPAALCDVCGKELSKTKECAWTSCPLNWSESRADIIGQNGNIGYE